MPGLKRFSTAIGNDVGALLIFVGLWAALATFFPPYLLPSPGTVLLEIPRYFQGEFAHHLAVTLYRTVIGFALAFVAGGALGIAAFRLRLTESLNGFMASVQVLPGTIIGIIFLLMFGVGSATPIALVALLTMPTVAINTANALSKRNIALEQYVLSAGGNWRHLVRYLYLPALIPTTRSNLTLGMGLALKIVILGEFIGAQDGIGYLLNVARVYFNMKEVWFYLLVILLVTALFQVTHNALSKALLRKYLYPD
jgi:NitT/TauT family transport system permease protein